MMCKTCKHKAVDHVFYKGWWHCIYVDRAFNGYKICFCKQERTPEMNNAE